MLRYTQKSFKCRISNTKDTIQYKNIIKTLRKPLKKNWLVWDHYLNYVTSLTMDKHGRFIKASVKTCSFDVVVFSYLNVPHLKSIIPKPISYPTHYKNKNKNKHALPNSTAKEKSYKYTYYKTRHNVSMSVEVLPVLWVTDTWSENI